MSKEDIEKQDEKPEAIMTDNLSISGQSFSAGLYLVATPIGNLRDITIRALDVLRAADFIYCEDTRVTRKLLGAYQIRGNLRTYNDHSDEARRDEIFRYVTEGRVVALVSDAGMPLISDPGYKLVLAAQKHGVLVTTLPGANAPLSALQLSAIPSNRFSFLGFLPSKRKARTSILEQWRSVDSTLILFESSARLVPCLVDISDVLSGRNVAVVREITKLYEEVRRGQPADLISHYETSGLPRGEIVIVIAPPDQELFSDDAVFDMIRNALESMKTKDAAAFVAEKTGLKKSDLYKRALEIREDVRGGE